MVELDFGGTLITDELRRRPSRPPDYESEARALAALARELADDPRELLEKVVETAMDLCRADSAGVDIDEPEPRSTQERLRAPLELDGEPAGTLWVSTRTPDRQFDSEDARMLASLARFAAAALRTNLGSARAEPPEAPSGTSELEQAYSALRESESHLQLALDAAEMGTFVWDPETDRCEADSRMLALFGLPEDATINLSTALATLIHVEDRALYAAAVARAIDPEGPRTLDEEVRFVRPDGSQWVGAVTGRVHFERARAARLAGVIADVTDRKRADVAAEHERAQRERLEREFITNAAHELRTPLTGVIAAAEILDAGAIDDPEARVRFMEHLRRESARLARLCDSLLLLATAQSARGVQRGPVALRPLLEEIANRVDARDGVEVEVRAADDDVIVANRGLCERALENLAENAAKHTASGRIELEAMRAGSSVVIEVRDTGSGVDAETAERAFDRFYRGTERGADGFGLGLSIANEAAKALGAELTLEARSGGGAVARLAFPPCEADAAPGDDAAREQRSTASVEAE